LVDREAFQYRVWAESNQGNIPMDSPYVDFTPHPTGVPDKVVPAFRPPNPALISMDGFNKNAQGTADPWLGADKTVTVPPSATPDIRNRVDNLADLGSSYPLPSLHLRLGWMP